jgi:hypothetical protein
MFGINYLYQIITNKNERERDAAMYLIYANFIVSQIGDASSSEFAESNNNSKQTLRRKLQARIICPTFFIFSEENSAVQNRSMSPLYTTNTRTRAVFDSYIQNEISRLKIEQYQLLKKELVRAKRKYNKLEVANKKAYNIGFNSDYVTYVAAVAAADPNAVEPVYNYVPLSELENTRLQSQLSVDAYEVYTSILEEEPDIETFDDLAQILSERLKVEHSIVLGNLKSSRTKLAYRGIVINQPADTQLEDFQYTLQLTRQAFRYYIVISLKLPYTKIDIRNNTYAATVDENDPQTVNNENVLNMNGAGIFTGTFFKQNRLIIPAGSEELFFECTLLIADTEYVINKTFMIGLDQTITGILIPNEEGGEELPEIVSENTNELDTKNPIKYGVTRLGIKDYRLVEQSICCYVPGEVSHIENIMAKEIKDKITKRLRRVENSITLENTSETEHLTDTTSTERNEMHQEIAKMQQLSNDFNFNAGISGKILKQEYHLDTSYALHNSKEESNTMAFSEAKDLTIRAMDRIVSKVREERTTKITEEFSEENRHGFDNSGEGATHISGVYRWVDVIYKNQIFNYGKRLMYEFMIPDPSKIHQIFLQPNKELFTIKEPIDPRIDKNNPDTIEDFTKITRENYQIWASIYNAEVEAPPAEYVIVGKSYSALSISEDATGSWQKEWNDLVVPKGYYLSVIVGNHECRRGYPNQKKDLHMNSNIQIANQYVVSQRKSGGFDYDFGLESSLQQFTIDVPAQISLDTIPVSVICWDVSSFILNVNCKLLCSEEHLQTWQIKTFNAIIEAYEAKLEEYRNQLDTFNAEQEKNKSINALFYRDIEKTILRKHCIAYLIGYDKLGKNFQKNKTFADHQISPNAVDSNGSELSGKDSLSIRNYGSLIKFMEQAFEWDIMSYIFYPFYWADKNRWTDMYAYDSGDTLFSKFMQSGMARVIVTVRPGFEDAVNWFMTTGMIWNGLNAPVIGDDMYLSIVDELLNPEYTVEGEWETRVPTSLTLLQAQSAGLIVEQPLPCYCEPSIVKEHFELEDNTLSVQSEGVGSWTVNPDPQ